ncbi:tetratricopeptide repeat protein [Thermomonospora cellulosilytica]|uniref:Tetratricopeptide (TPR) repeat protein n=1 Tax=Thermomonospora cellulosilytica TaxID=1411118 RepID=A0A7W3N1F0_9ACTN|nr:tetratricopeptide repeat protein [Thermomonospora cellulosilytica]MBA9005719.1 tetratricopeptide (TPR) repeat protein [Thermomonospora cellulosilytica]
MADDGGWDRRSLLRGAAVVAGAAATAPLLGKAATAQADGGDADALFRAGKFEQAGRAYEEILKNDPGNVHAARQRGYVGLLANRFPDAEKYLKMAVTLAPDDREANRFLGDCYIRQDKFSLSVPHWQAAGENGYAKLFAAFRGEPYQIHGDIARVPWKQMDPSPLVEASLNGGPPRRFSFYTRLASLNLSQKAAEEAGLRAVVEEQFEHEGRTVTSYSGVLDSFKLGGIELRNIPVSWSDAEDGAESLGDGLIGTWILYHFLTTVDYAGRSLILRRRTPETARQARADAERAGAEPLPLWLAHEHLLFSRGSIAGSGARVVGLHIGGPGEMAAGITEETAKQLRIRTDYDRPREAFAGGRPIVSHPCYPKEIRLGNAAAKDVYCYANNRSALGREGFEVVAHFSHSFYKPYNVTLDFTDMNVYIAPGRAT